VPTQQIGISPKVIGQLVASAVAWALAHFAVQLPPEAAAAIAAVVGGLAGYVAPPGAVAHQQPATASDDMLDPNVEAQIKAVPPPA
jgi:hypothetical protein